MLPVILFLIGILLSAIVIFASLLVAFWVGVRAFSRTGTSHRAYALTLGFLGLCLCEPLVSAILVALLGAWMFSTNNFGNPLPMTAPMAVLLLPALGLAFDDPFYRRKCLQIALLGVARWAAIALFVVGIHERQALIVILTPIVAIGLLWWAIVWARRQLKGALAAEPAPSGGLELLERPNA